jgi:hypothetical protein
VHLASWFNDQIERLEGPVLDDWGYARREVRGRPGVWSEHASGTALDLNAQLHPMGSRDTFSSEQRARLDARLKGAYRGAIEWGGHWRTRPDEMHFQLAPDQRAVLLAARRVALRARARRLLDANDLDLAVLTSRQ